jgi:HSP20 family protein
MACDPLKDLRAWQERLERLAAQNGSGWSPPVDVYETEDRYVLAAELPGLSRDQIDVAVQENRLTIGGTRRGVPEATHHYHQVERGHGPFQRSFEFADPIQSDGVTADLRDGVLTVTLPKTSSPPRRIAVS